MFTQRWNCLTTHFSEHIPMVKWCITVYSSRNSFITFTQAQQHILLEITSILSTLSLFTFNFNVILPGIQRYSDVLNLCNKYLKFETNQVKCQLLGYDTVQTGKYLVWVTASTFYTADEGSVLFQNVPTYLTTKQTMQCHKPEDHNNEPPLRHQNLRGHIDKVRIPEWLPYHWPLTTVNP